ncbi:acyl carrier protein [Micromonospora sp. WMMD882]|uniref:acyl carrier protein n=1 Tax=Micromonospora sp. WMMD882 TaxID=3015151 RepID=UPI00248BB60A|nr:acyl carrier protein [Micromonospora sp. WMMD882]WBB81394.1 acyl carrier protein [Micromonospora sp. WMMD882]
MITVEQVCEMVQKKLRGKNAEEITLGEQTAFDELGLSSLQVADIVYGIEDQLGIEFDPSRAADVKTIGDLVELANTTAQVQA